MLLTSGYRSAIAVTWCLRSCPSRNSSQLGTRSSGVYSLGVQFPPHIKVDALPLDEVFGKRGKGIDNVIHKTSRCAHLCSFWLHLAYGSARTQPLRSWPPPRTPLVFLC